MKSKIGRKGGRSQKGKENGTRKRKRDEAGGKGK
jgi:hypothetical protein